MQCPDQDVGTPVMSMFSFKALTPRACVPDLPAWHGRCHALPEVGTDVIPHSRRIRTGSRGPQEREDVVIGPVEAFGNIRRPRPVHLASLDLPARGPPPQGKGCGENPRGTGPDQDDGACPASPQSGAGRGMQLPRQGNSAETAGIDAGWPAGFARARRERLAVPAFALAVA